VLALTGGPFFHERRDKGAAGLVERRGARNWLTEEKKKDLVTKKEKEKTKEG